MTSDLQTRLEKLRERKNEVITQMSDPTVLKNQKEYELLVRELKDIDK
jgi:protein subunit release factor A